MPRSHILLGAWHAAASARGVGSRIARVLGRMRLGAREPVALVLRESSASSVLVGRSPLAVRCAHGSVWVTHSRDREDHILEGGQQYVASGRGRLAVFALEPSRVLLLPAGKAT